MAIPLGLIVAGALAWGVSVPLSVLEVMHFSDKRDGTGNSIKTVPAIVKFQDSNFTRADMSVMDGMKVVLKRDAEGRSGEKMELRNDEKNVTLEGEIEKGTLSHGFHHGRISISMDDGRVEKGQWIAIDMSKDGKVDNTLREAFGELYRSIRKLHAEEIVKVLEMLENVVDSE